MSNFFKVQLHDDFSYNNSIAFDFPQEEEKILLQKEANNSP